MNHLIIFIPVEKKDTANAALFSLFGDGWEATFIDAQASPTGAAPATELYAGFPADEAGVEDVQNLWAADFPAGAVYPTVITETLPTLNAALLERGLKRVEPE